MSGSAAPRGSEVLSARKQAREVAWLWRWTRTQSRCWHTVMAVAGVVAVGNVVWIVHRIRGRPDMGPEGMPKPSSDTC